MHAKKGLDDVKRACVCKHSRTVVLDDDEIAFTTSKKEFGILVVGFVYSNPVVFEV